MPAEPKARIELETDQTPPTSLSALRVAIDDQPRVLSVRVNAEPSASKHSFAFVNNIFGEEISVFDQDRKPRDVATRNEQRARPEFAEVALVCEFIEDLDQPRTAR